MQGEKEDMPSIDFAGQELFLSLSAYQGQQLQQPPTQQADLGENPQRMDCN